MHERLHLVLRVALSAALLLWGGYTLIIYLGIPVHQVVLITETDKALIDAACGNAGTWCQGWHALFPFLVRTFTWAAPYLWYGILSALLYGAFVLVAYLRTGEWTLSFRLCAWKILLLFVASLWLLFVVIGYGQSNDQPMRRLFEPLPQVYVNASTDTLNELHSSFVELRDRGCLTHIGQTNHGAQVYDLKGICMQMSFVTRVLSQLLMLLILIADMLILGRLLLRLLKANPEHPLLEFLVSMGMGIGATVAVLWTIAVLSLYTQLAGWALLIIIPVLGYKDTLYWGKQFLFGGWQVRIKSYHVTMLLAWLVITYFAFNFLSVVRPFPIGWDDLGSYLNRPRLLVSYGHFIPSMATFQWEYLTSLGFLLFGYDSVFGATFSMIINWMAGLYAVLLVFAFPYLFLGSVHGWLAALLYYSLPVVGHFSFADMKVDNGVFAFGAVSLLLTFAVLFPIRHTAEGEDDEEPLLARTSVWRYLLVAGALAGVGFAMKPTAVIVIAALGAVLLGAGIHWTAFIGALGLQWTYFFIMGPFNAREVSSKIFGNPDVLPAKVLALIALLVGLGFLGYAFYYYRSVLPRVMLGVGAFLVGFFIAIAPWNTYNGFQYGDVRPRLRLTSPNHIAPSFVLAGEEVTEYGQDIRRLPPELMIDPKHAACTGTSRYEELDRYWGFGSGWQHYLLLPWRVVMNIDATGYYVTVIPGLLLFPLLLLMPAFWSRREKWMRYLWVATTFMIVQWMFFANGILWYGVGMFLGLVVALEFLVARAPDRWSRILAGMLVTLSLFVAFGMRLWQSDTQRNLFEYPLGKITGEAMRERTIPHYDDVRDVALQRRTSMPDRPYVFRAGTFIPYFIPKNLEVLPLADNQLDFFNCLYQERNDALTLKRLQTLGFNSVIFDTNTHTIEKDPNGSLHKKVGAFVQFLNNTGLGLQIVVNDPSAGIAYVLLP